MKHLKLFENFESKLTLDYLQTNYPIKLDNKYEEFFGKKRYYINIDGDVYYYSFDENGNPTNGFNRLKRILLNSLESDGIILDLFNDTQLIKQYLRSI